MNNIFVQATRNKLRFDSAKGQLSVEQLWDVPLASKAGDFDLDSIAKVAKRELDAASEESFVKATTPGKARAELKLEIVKFIIAAKIEERDNAVKKAGRAELRQQLTQALADKQADAIKGLSAEEIQKRLADLDND